MDIRVDLSRASRCRSPTSLELLFPTVQPLAELGGAVAPIVVIDVRRVRLDPQHARDRLQTVRERLPCLSLSARGQHNGRFARSASPRDVGAALGAPWAMARLQLAADDALAVRLASASGGARGLHALGRSCRVHAGADSATRPLASNRSAHHAVHRLGHLQD